MYPPVSSVIYTLFEQLGMTAASLMYFHDRPLIVVYHNNLPGPNKKKRVVLSTGNKSLSSVITQIGFCNTNIHWIAIYPLESTSYPTFEKPEPFHY